MLLGFGFFLFNPSENFSLRENVLFVVLGKISFFAFSPEEKRRGKGKGLLESKALHLILCALFCERLFLNKKEKSPHFELDRHLIIKIFDGKLPLSSLISITLLNPECYQVLDTGWLENLFVNWFQCCNS